MGTDIARFADVGMFHAEPDTQAQRGHVVTPRVTLISQTAKPLQVMAAAAEMYKGHVVRDVQEVDKRTAMFWFTEMTRTKLQAALEFVDFHFLIEGVSRAFTHQLVRQRTAVYVQESMRFAVKDNAAFEVSLPPTLAMLKDDDPKRAIWDNAVKSAGRIYNSLINAGVPAEDARGLLPTNITTRIHYKTNLRGLAEHSGLRLCSQAQFEWKQVWDSIIKAIVTYGPAEDAWQQAQIVGLFAPVCYQTGRCEFRGENDRWCVIRDRVEAHFKKGEGPELWADINPLEPLMDGAARLKPGSPGSPGSPQS